MIVVRNPLWGIFLFVAGAAIASSAAAGGQPHASPPPVIFRKGPALVRIEGLSRGDGGYRLPLAGELIVTVILTAPTQGSDVECVWPQDRAWQVEPRERAQQLRDDNIWRWSASWYVAPTSRGKQTLPLPRIEFVPADGTEPSRISWPTIPVEVTAARKKASLEDVEDDLPFEPPPQGEDNRWMSAVIWIGAAVAIVAAVAVIAFRMFLRRRSERLASSKENGTAPALLRLEHELGAESFDVDRFLEALHDYLRSMAGEGEREGEVTPAELRLQLERAGELPPERIAAVVACFERCEEARYAPSRPDRRTCLEWLDAVRSLAREESPGR